MTSDKKQILLSVSGETAPVITETTYGLWEKQINREGGEIHILTTTFGRNKLQPLLGQHGKLVQFNHHYGTQWELRPEWIEVIHDRGDEFDDLRTTKANELAADQIVEAVRQWTERDDVQLHASMAGGRKTMGTFLKDAMSWFARPDDTLSHVLVRKDLEDPKKNFYYPEPDNLEHDNSIDFILQPFIHMRRLIPAALKIETQYSRIVALSQVILNASMGVEPNLVLDTENRCLRAGDTFEIKMQPISQGLFLFLYRHANIANDQQPFRFYGALDFREALSKALCDVNTSKSETGISSLASGDIKTYPPHWQDKGDHNKCKTDCDNGFVRLSTDLRPISHTGFAVQGRGQRFVNITNLALI